MGGLCVVGYSGSRIYPSCVELEVERGRVIFGARPILGRVIVMAEGTGVGLVVLLLAMLLRLWVVLVEGIVDHGPHSMVLVSVSTLHCGPSIRQARLRDGEVRS